MDKIEVNKIEKLDKTENCTKLKIGQNEFK